DELRESVPLHDTQCAFGVADRAATRQERDVRVETRGGRHDRPGAVDVANVTVTWHRKERRFEVRRVDDSVGTAAARGVRSESGTTVSVVYNATGRLIVTPPSSATTSGWDGSGTCGREMTVAALRASRNGTIRPTASSGTMTRSL